MHDEVNPPGRPRTVLTDEERRAFSARYSVIMFFECGTCDVLDSATGEFCSFPAFRREFGVKGEQWLDGDPPTYMSMQHYHIVNGFPWLTPSTPVAVPEKNPYTPRTGDEHA